MLHAVLVEGNCEWSPPMLIAITIYLACATLYIHHHHHLVTPEVLNVLENGGGKKGGTRQRQVHRTSTLGYLGTPYPYAIAPLQTSGDLA